MGWSLPGTGIPAAGAVRTTPSLQWHELDADRAAGETLIDVRSPGEHAVGGIPGAVNLPLDERRDRLNRHLRVGI